jgi:hypothetical protein
MAMCFVILRSESWRCKALMEDFCGRMLVRSSRLESFTTIFVGDVLEGPLMTFRHFLGFYRWRGTPVNVLTLYFSMAFATAERERVVWPR